MLDDFECLREAIRLAGDVVLNCEIDGVQLGDLQDYYSESPAFAIDSTAGSTAEAFGFPPCLNGPAVDSGYYLMLPPLRPGVHVISFRGESGAFGFFNEVTYYLTVTPER